MAGKTTYSVMGADDQDAAVFLCEHLADIDIFNLPQRVWIAREHGKVVAALMLHSQPVPCLDFIFADAATRPFMRMYRLWLLAKAWATENKVPLLCAYVRNELVHYQHILKRLGFARVGEQVDDDGNAVETIFGWKAAA